MLVDAGPDVLAIETVPDIDEAQAVVALVHELGIPAWLSYTIDGTTTRAGQPLADAFAVAADVPEVVAVGVNCCAPDDVEHAIGVAREVTGKPVVVYPNSGEEWDGERRTWIGQPRLVDRPGAAMGGREARASSAAAAGSGPSDIADIAANVGQAV